MKTGARLAICRATMSHSWEFRRNVRRAEASVSSRGFSFCLIECACRPALHFCTSGSDFIEQYVVSDEVAQNAQHKAKKPTRITWWAFSYN